MKPKLDRYRLGGRETPTDVATCLATVGKVDRRPARTETIEFFDTFDWRLFGDGKSVSVAPGANGPEVHLYDHERETTVAVVPGGLATGFVSDFPDGRIRDLMDAIIDVRRLLPRLEVVSRHTAIALRDREGKVILRVTLDKCSARGPDGGRAVPLGTYLTMEPVRGYAAAADKARALIEARFAPPPAEMPLHVAGFQAVGVTPGDYSSKLHLDLDPAMTAGEAARLIHLNLLETMERNEDGTARNLDAEFLHDFRVAVRRTRSALGQVDKDVLPAAVIADAKNDFRWIGQQTNDMRDLDVYLIDYPHLQARLPDAYKGHLGPFRDFLAARSREETKRVAAMIRGKRYRRIRDAWRTYLTTGFEKPDKAADADTPVKALADRRIWKAYRRVMKEGEAIDESSPAEALHALRITCKKLRYLLEFFQSLYPAAEIGDLIKALKTFQNVLGEFQDTAIQAQAILDFGRKMAAADAAPVETQMAMGMLAESILLRQDTARAAFRDRFAAFSRPRVRRSFTALFRNGR